MTNTYIQGRDGKMAGSTSDEALAGPGSAATVGPMRVKEALEGYQREHRPDEDGIDWSVTADYIADVLHYADSQGIDVEQVLRVAQSHYYEESEEAEADRNAVAQEARERMQSFGGMFTDGYTAEDIDYAFAVLEEATGQRVICLWSDYDYEPFGDSAFYTVDEDGDLWEASGAFHAWLLHNGDRPDDTSEWASVGASMNLADVSPAGEGRYNFMLRSATTTN